MKKSSIIIFCFLAIVVLMVINNFIMKKSVAPVVEKHSVLFAESRPYCFSYTHAATPDAPYAVSEYVSLTRVRDTISGTKRGTQAGPDMTNGYEGILEGKLSDEGFRALFTYTVEGTTQSEQEVYRLTDTTLTKLRYQLREEKGVLVPIETGQSVELVYTPVACGN